jgi:hypothetical protein
MDEIVCTMCGGNVRELLSRLNYILLECKIKKCSAVFDYGIRELEDELHRIYVRLGREPIHRTV